MARSSCGRVESDAANGGLRHATSHCARNRRTLASDCWLQRRLGAPPRRPIEADYAFAVTAAPGQLEPSGERAGNAVYPGQSLRLDFTNTTGPDNPCPSEAAIEVTDAAGTVVATATGFSVQLPDRLDGPLTITDERAQMVGRFDRWAQSGSTAERSVAAISSTSWWPAATDTPSS